MKKEVLDKIKILKNKYEPDGFIVLGIFGSYARGEENEKSDIDILYEMTGSFYRKYPGWDIFPIIDEIEKEFSKAKNLKRRYKKNWRHHRLRHMKFLT